MIILGRTISIQSRGRILLPVLLAVMTGTAAGQHLGMSARRCDLRGEIVGIEAWTASRLMVEVRAGARSMRTPVSTAGSFEFVGLSEGQYEVAVTNLYGSVITREFVALPYGAGRFTIRLPKVERERPVSGVVSVQRLQHKVPKAARKQFEKALDAAQANDSDRAVKHLQKAIEIDPEYMEAYNNLGARYLHLNRVEQALECFEKALKLDPGAPEPAANAAMSLLRLKRLEEAEKAAARALEIDQQSPLASLVRGTALAALGREPDEAVRLLDRAADRYPVARLTAARVLAQSGDKQNARQKIERYLASGDQQYKTEAQTLLARLETSSN